ncbi:MAG: hypothetical protein B7733_17185 [Myxococcales bacterium FL481]|nr:MAG: hypothetical protein B7733_17185 [Myxococcales bacterium FL481]
MGDNGRLYREREVKEILKRAAELHHAHDSSDSSKAMTRREIEDVARELGIPAALVARATNELVTAERRRPSAWWLGGKTGLTFEYQVQGRLDDATFDRLVEALRRALHDAGTLTEQRSTRIWTTQRPIPRAITLTVFEDDEETTVRLDERMPIDARTTVGASSFAGFGSSIFSAIPLKVLLGKAAVLVALPGVMLGGAALGWAIGRQIWRRRSAAREDQLRTVFADLVAIVDRAHHALAAGG